VNNVTSQFSVFTVPPRCVVLDFLD